MTDDLAAIEVVLVLDGKTLYSSYYLHLHSELNENSGRDRFCPHASNWYGEVSPHGETSGRLFKYKDFYFVPCNNHIKSYLTNSTAEEVML